MINPIQKLQLLFLLLISFTIGAKAINSIETGYTIIKVRTAVKNNQTYLVASSYEGVLLAYNYNGQKLWENKLSGYMNQDIWCDDLDGDGNDEILTANADGHIYCLSDEGKPKWNFKYSDAPMYSVTVVRDTQGKPYVVCGGYDLSIFYLNPANGELLKKVHSSTFSKDSPWGVDPIPEKNRSSTNFLRPIKIDGKEYLLMLGTCNSMQTRNSLYLFNVMGGLVRSGTSPTGNGDGDMRIVNTNNSNTDEIILCSSGMLQQANTGFVNPKDMSGQTMAYWDISSKFDAFGYRVVQTVPIPKVTGFEYFTLLGTRVVLTPSSRNMKDSEVLVNKYSYNDMWQDESRNYIIFGSAQSGGSCIHVIDLNDSNWKNQYVNLQPPGKLSKLLTNTTNYRNMLKGYSKPNYQPTPRTVFWLGKADDAVSKQVEADIAANYTSPVIIDNVWMTHVEDSTSSGHKFLPNAHYRDRYDPRKTYDWSQSQVLSFFDSKLGSNSNGVAFWGGHGNDPYYFSLETLKKIIDKANGRKVVFLYPELEQHNSDFAWFLDYHIFPLAEYAKDKNANIYVRTKNIFWQGAAHMDLWDEMQSGKYADVFVPAMEETSDKMMDVSVPGRMGFWLTGATDTWGARTARDEATYDRLREFSHQAVPNHFLRQYIYNIANGATVIDHFNYNMEYMSFIWELIAKEVLYVPKRDELLSISPVHLSMIDVNEHYLNEGTAIKWTTFFNQQTEDANPMVWSRMNGTWPGAPVTEWDYSAYASGIKDRRVNYLPPTPNGLVLVTLPQEGAHAVQGAPRGKLKDNLHPLYKDIMKEYYTDGHSYYDANGNSSMAANTYYTTVKNDIENSAKKLPVTVTGDEVAWVVAQLDETHLRLTLVDGGWINPNDRTVKVSLNTDLINPASMRDIVDGTTFNVSNPSNISVDVPCGLFRFIDIELKQPFGTSTGKPSVSFEIPKSNQQFLPGDDIEVTVNASDNGSVSDVKLYLNNQLVREEKSAPYQWGAVNQNDALLQNVAQGTYSLKAVATDNEGNTAESSISIHVGEIISDLIIEAEDFNNTGGTVSDSKAGVGVFRESDAISWVNEGDWAEYTLNVPVDGEYTITYSISSSKNGAEIQFIVDGNVVSTDAVNNNASWNTWYALEASNKATLTKGSHTIWVKGVGANNDFQWNLEKITLSKTNDETMHINDELLEDVILSPNPFDNTLQINGGETIASLKVTALNGVTLVFKEVNATSIVLNTNDLSSGIFLIHLLFENGKQSIKKVIKL